MWSYPALFYAQPDKEKLFEHKIKQLEETTNKYLELLNEPRESIYEDFDRFIDILFKQINDILTIAETF